MKKATLRLSVLAGAAAVSAMAVAQTATTHHTATTAHRTTHPVATKSLCVAVPELSPKIPAVPAGTPCPKALVTISESIEFSPLVGPELRSIFPNTSSTFSLDYQDVRVGAGEPAQPHMWYTVKYTGYFTDGTKFDSSEDHPELKNGISFPYGAHRVISGWDMGFEGMHIGGKRRLFVPYQLGYGEHGRPSPVPGKQGIPPKSELIFDMELVAQNPTNPNPPPTPPVGAHPVPGAPGTLPVTPPTTAPGASPQTPPSAHPQAAPGTPAAPQTQPQAAKPATPPGL